MKWSWLEEQSKKWPPVPFVVAGYDVQRWETPGGNDAYLQKFAKKLIFWKKGRDTGLGDIWGPTHIQYQSPWGFLITWPFCFHFWIQFRPQTTGFPGTERVFYWRFGIGRWDAHDSKYICPTWYGPGLHWD